MKRSTIGAFTGVASAIFAVATGGLALLARAEARTDPIRRSKLDSSMLDAMPPAS